MEITIRHSEPEDYEALRRIFGGPKAIAGTLQMPLPSAETWRKRLSEPPEGLYSLVACVEGEVIGSLGLVTSPTRWRMRHVGSIGMAVRDDWQGKGVGTALMEAALDLADNWLNLKRIELSVYVDNAPAIALYEKFAFEIEGTPPLCLQGWRVRGRLLYGPPQALSTQSDPCIRLVFWGECR